MGISKEKTKAVIFKKFNTVLQHNINKENEQIEQVNDFEFLGSLFTENGDSSKEIKVWIVIATAVDDKAKTLWKTAESP